METHDLQALRALHIIMSRVRAIFPSGNSRPSRSFAAPYGFAECSMRYRRGAYHAPVLPPLCKGLHNRIKSRRPEGFLKPSGRFFPIKPVEMKKTVCYNVDKSGKAAPGAPRQMNEAEMRNA